MKYRRHDWLDLNTQNPLFGIQAKYGGKWRHIIEGGEPLIYKTEAERDAKMKELQKRSASRVDCACNGVLASDRMCGYITVASNRCGAPDDVECEHKRHARRMG